MGKNAKSLINKDIIMADVTPVHERYSESSQAEGQADNKTLIKQ